MALREFLILRKLRSSCLEGRTVLIQLDFFTRSFAGKAISNLRLRALRALDFFTSSQLRTRGL